MSRWSWDLEKMFESPKPIRVGKLHDDFKTVDKPGKGHGRLEERRITVSSQLKDYVDWPYLEQAFKLERRFLYIKTGQIKKETLYDITSLPKAQASPGMKILLGLEDSMMLIQRMHWILSGYF